MKKMEDDLILLKFKDGEDFFQKLKEEISRHHIRSGLILSGVGMLRRLTLGYFMGDGKYNEISVTDPVELTSMQGNIAMAEEDVAFHIHITGAMRGGKVVGGHLISATVNVVNELVILKLDKIRLKRILNERTGLLELFITHKSGS